MAINSFTTNITADQTFQDWLNRTNSIGASLSNVVTMGGADQNNNSSIYVDQFLETEDRVKTNLIEPHSGTDIVVDALFTTKTQTIRVPKAGDNSSLQFQYFEDQGDSDAGNDVYVDTWRMGPHESTHTKFQIIGHNAVNSQPEAELTIAQPSGPVGTGTKGIVSGTNIEISNTILPDDIAAATAASWANARIITFGAVDDVASDVVGTFSINGSADVTARLSLGAGVGGDTTEVFLGGGLIGTEATGDNTVIAAVDGFTTINSTNVIGHYIPATVASDTSTGQAVTNLTFDSYGHVTGASSIDLGGFVLSNPSSDAQRSTISGNGLLVGNNIELAFGRSNGSETDSLSGESFIKYTKANNADNDNLEIVATCPDLILMSKNRVVIGDNETNDTIKFEFETTTGNLICQGDITAFGTASDESLKENIEPIQNALDKVSSISGYTFNYIDSPEKGRVPGVIAQELEQVLPEAVYETNDGKKAVRYDNTIALLIEAIKELQQQVQDLKNNK